MTLGQEGEISLVGDVFKLYYLTNPGLAFGISVGEGYAKLSLSLFRILATCAIAYYFTYLLRKAEHRPAYIAAIGVILGGAIGNVIDSTFYGIWLDNAPPGAPMPWFYGQVIDMLYVDIWEGYVPREVPVIGGTHFFLWPVFNIADAAIFCGIASILLFQKYMMTVPSDSASTDLSLDAPSQESESHLPKI